MTIHNLYLMCSNMTNASNIRVIDEGHFIFIGSYREMPDYIKVKKVLVFDFDNDLNGCIIVIRPA